MEQKRIELFSDCLQGILASLVHAAPKKKGTSQNRTESYARSGGAALPLSLSSKNLYFIFNYFKIYIKFIYIKKAYRTFRCGRLKKYTLKP